MPLIQGTANKIISFAGNIDSNTETSLITQVEEYLDSIKCVEARKMRVMEVMIELLQNVLHHAPPITDKDTTPQHIFQLENTKAGFMVSTSNPIKTKNILALKKRIDYLNSLTPDEVTSLQKDILKNGNDARETAGLGFIDMLKKSRSKILFRFDPPTPDNNYSLFSVNVLVG